jgi:hypothetical protein
MEDESGRDRQAYTDKLGDSEREGTHLTLNRPHGSICHSFHWSENHGWHGWI